MDGSRRHRRSSKRLCFNQKGIVCTALRDTFPPDTRHHGDGERRDPFQLFMYHRPCGAIEQRAKALHVGHPGTRIGPGGLKQQMIRLIAAQNIIDKVRLERDLPTGLALAGDLALDQPPDHCNFAKCPLQQSRIFDPAHKFIRHDIGREQRRWVLNRL